MNKRNFKYFFPNYLVFFLKIPIGGLVGAKTEIKVKTPMLMKILILPTLLFVAPTVAFIICAIMNASLFFLILTFGLSMGMLSLLMAFLKDPQDLIAIFALPFLLLGAAGGAAGSGAKTTYTFFAMGEVSSDGSKLSQNRWFLFLALIGIGGALLVFFLMKPKSSLTDMGKATLFGLLMLFGMTFLIYYLQGIQKTEDKSSAIDKKQEDEKGSSLDS